MKKKIITSNSREETETIAREFAKELKGGEIIALYGKLGAGKTVFVQSIAQALGINRRIPSPTFTIMRSYQIPLHRGKILHHVDLYRIKSIKDLHSLDLNEIINNPKHITCIEWAEKAEQILPRKSIKIYIVYKGKYKREIKIIRN